MNMKKSLLIISLLLILCISLGAVSAADIDVNDVNQDNSVASTIAVDGNNDGGGDTAIINLKEDEKTFKDLNKDINKAIEEGNNSITLNDNYKYNSTDNLASGIIINHDNFVIDGNGVTIDGSDLARVFNITANNVTIKNINFINVNGSYGGAIYCEGANFSIIDCNFVNTYASRGTAIFYQVTAENSSVISCNFTNSNVNGAYGGVIYGLAPYLSVINSNFVKSSSADCGAAIYLEANNYLLDNCTFVKSYVSVSGGSIYLKNCSEGVVSNCTFINSSAGHGGAIYLEGNDNSVIDCTFIDSYAKINGGAISVDMLSNNCSVINCTFINSSSLIAGGAIYWNGTNGSIDGSNFINSSSLYGSAIYIPNSASLAIINSTCTPIVGDKDTPIYNNGAILSDVVITTLNGTNKNATYATEVNLSASITASGIPVSGGTVTLTVNNKEVNATSEGKNFYSALYIIDFLGTKPVNATYINVVGNQSVEVYNITGVAVSDSLTNLAYEIEHCEGNEFVLTHNYYYYPDYDSKNGINVNKTNFIINGNGFTINGGESARVFNISTENITIKNINFINTSYDGVGGAILWGGANGIVSDCNFTNSHADNGGAILWKSVNGTVKDCNFINSTANVGGGAIVLNGDAKNCIISNCSFINCSSNDDGGAIYLFGGNATINGSNFVNCSATNIGGAIYLSSSNTTISGSNFVNCSATNIGGAIYLSSSNVTINESDFVNCSANNSGGAIYLSGKSATIKGSDFVNCASNSGGAIYLSGNSATISGSDFVNCSATNKGDVIYIFNTGSLNISDSNCTPINEKAPVYNDGILFDVVITTLNGTNTSIAWLDSINLTATVNAGGLGVTGGILTLKVNNTELNATSDDKGIYSASELYTTDFVGDKLVTANYLNGSGSQNVNAGNLNVFNATFTQLAKDIANCEGDELILTHDYRYYEDYDSVYQNGINLTKSNFVIDGNGFTIDGSNLASVFFVECENVTFKNINFINTNGDDSAIYISGDNCNVSNCNFTNCHIEYSGAAIGSSCNNSIISDCNFINCSADQGGAIYLSGVNGIISNCNFINTSANFGGAIVLSYSNNDVVKNCSFINSHAVYDGAAISISRGSSLNITDSTYTSLDGNNKAAIYNDGTLYNVVITTMEGETKNVAYGELINLTATVNAGGLSVAGRLLTLSIDTNIVEISADSTGLYATEYTVGFYGDRQVFAKYNAVLNQSLIPGEVSCKLDSDLYVENLVANKDVPIDLVAYLASDATGFITFYINDTEVGISKVDNGIAKYTITPSELGNFTINAVYTGDNKYLASNITANLIVVGPVEPSMNVSVVDIVYGEDLIIIVNLPSDAKGNVTLFIADLNGTLAVENGTVLFNISGIPTDTYRFILNYSGDKNYKSKSYDSSFTVNKYNSTISVSASNVTYPSDVTVTVNLDAIGATGEITYYINGEKYTTKEVSDLGLIIKNLSAGNYYLLVEYSGDLNNAKSSANCSFAVSKNDSYNMSISANDTTVGANELIIVNLPSDATGFVTFYVNDVKVGVSDIESGVAKCTYIPDKAGKFTITAVYTGNDKYVASNATGDLTVNKSATTLIGNDFSIVAYTSNNLVVTLKDINGNVLAGKEVLITLNGKNYTRTTDENGQAKLAVASSYLNTYTADIKFAGDNDYLESSVSVKITVNAAYISIADIIKAANTLKLYSYKNKTLPATIQVGSCKLTHAQLSYLMAAAIKNINAGKSVSTKIKVINVKATNYNPKVSVKVTQANYLTVVNTIYTSGAKGTLPKYVTAGGKNIGYDVYTYSLARILSVYNSAKQLPSYCLFENY